MGENEVFGHNVCILLQWICVLYVFGTTLDGCSQTFRVSSDIARYTTSELHETCSFIGLIVAYNVTLNFPFAMT
jgi:hypothetical protein